MEPAKPPLPICSNLPFHALPSGTHSSRRILESYICIAESRLNSVMKSLESAQGRCSRQSLAMVTAAHDLRQHIRPFASAMRHASGY
jgi:hypothetical protein